MFPIYLFDEDYIVTSASLLQINYVLSFEEITLKFISVNEQVKGEELVDWGVNYIFRCIHSHIL